MLQPNIVCDKIYNIDPAVLKQMGIKALALDIDNTLTLHDSQQVPEKVALFLDQMKQQGMGLFLVSNNSFERVQPYAQNLGLDFVSKAAKSPVFSIAGPDVIRTLTPISLAITPARVVLPSPGGP